VPAGQQSDQQSSNHAFLANQYSADFINQICAGLRVPRDLLLNLLSNHRWNKRPAGVEIPENQLEKMNAGRRMAAALSATDATPSPPDFKPSNAFFRWKR
jgi:hypothetical protein